MTQLFPVYTNCTLGAKAALTQARKRGPTNLCDYRLPDFLTVLQVGRSVHISNGCKVW